MYECVCDNCGEAWRDDHNGWCAMTDESSMNSAISEDDGWLEHEGKHYCHKCITGFDDNDKIILKQVP